MATTNEGGTMGKQAARIKIALKEANRSGNRAQARLLKQALAAAEAELERKQTREVLS
jgi:hypothetical protein